MPPTGLRQIAKFHAVFNLSKSGMMRGQTWFRIRSGKWTDALDGRTEPIDIGNFSDYCSSENVPFPAFS